MRSYNKSSWWPVWVFSAVAIIIIVFAVSYHSSAEDRLITIKSTERVADNEDSKYLVWTTDGETLEITDSLFFFRWDSSDTYGKLEEGKTYKVLVAGWRVPFLSMYENIIKIIDSGSHLSESEDVLQEKK